MMKNNVKKNSVAKKLVPAAGMLALSASMLATSTYAWFTMSKDVQVTGIKMTATVPETLQLSVGNGQAAGTLVAAASGNADGALGVKAPANSNESLDWSNIADFKSFYGVASLIPASATNGASIYKTDDATGVGKTVSADGTSAAASPAASTSIATADKGTTLASTNGYYVDFPLWIRTSATGDVNLSVKATVEQGTAGDQDNKLYKAARVSILTGATNSTSLGVIVPYDSTNSSQGSYYVTDTALIGTGALGGNARNGAAYGIVDKIIQTTKDGTGEWSGGQTVITVPGQTATISSSAYTTGNSTKTSDANYGEAVCVTVRVWLEGEDVNCWNATAGQDFNIALDFSKITGTATADTGASAS
jgi:hypothetical protein